MFKKQLKQKLDNIYDLLIDFNNNERKHTKATEYLMRSYGKDNIKLSQMLENAKEVLKAREDHIEFQNNVISVQESEIQRLTKIIEEDKKFKEDIKEYLKTVAQIAANVQKAQLAKKISAVAYERNNMTKEAKAKLK